MLTTTKYDKSIHCKNEPLHPLAKKKEKKLSRLLSFSNFFLIWILSTYQYKLKQVISAQANIVY